MHRRLRIVLAALVIAAGAPAVHAALATFWQVSTESEFLKGEFENLSIDSYGRLTLGPTATSIYEASAPFLWTMVAAPDGSMYVGSGNDGHVFRIDATGKSSVFFDADELEVRLPLTSFLRWTNLTGWAGLAIGNMQFVAPRDEVVLAAGLAWERG